MNPGKNDAVDGGGPVGGDDDKGKERGKRWSDVHKLGRETGVSWADGE